MKELSCSRGHPLQPAGIKRFQELYKWDGPVTNGNIVVKKGLDVLLKDFDICCSESLTNLVEVTAVFEDIKGKFVPLINKWTREDNDVFNLMAATQADQDPVVISIQDLAKELKPWAYQRMMKTGQTDELKTILKLFLANKSQQNEENKEKEKERLAREAGPMKLDVDIKMIKECFGPATVCNNCESRGGSLKPKVECARGPLCCNTENNLKRCSACHIVAYCSEKCQKEHWINNHQKMCKIMSNKKKNGQQKHEYGKTCKWCTDMKQTKCIEKDPKAKPWEINVLLKKDNSNVPCCAGPLQIYLLEHYWLHFGYHRDAACVCTKEMKSTRQTRVNYPMQCPLNMGEITGTYLGWIDEKLAHLTFFISAIRSKYQYETESLGITTEIGNILKYLLTVRSTYWYFVTNEKKRYMTEVLFAQRLQVMSKALSEKHGRMFFTANEGFSKLDVKNVWWETFLHQLGDFYRRLRWTHHQMYDVVKIPEHRKEEFNLFSNIHKFALLCLNRQVDLLLPKKATRVGHINGMDFCQEFMSASFLIQLPEDSQCFVCKADLSNKTAAWQLQSPMHQALWTVLDSGQVTEDIVNDLIVMRHRNPPIPLIFEDKMSMPGLQTNIGLMTPEKWNIISCGVNKECTMKLVSLQIHYFEKLAKLTLNWVFKTHKCHSCLKFCYETHRCSNCRSVRYCSKDCLLEDWKVHEESCKDMMKEPQEVDTVNVRKLEGEQREVFFQECVDWLGRVDPTFHFFAKNWEHTKKGIDELITPAGDKPKKKKTKETSDSNSGKDDDKEPKGATDKEKKKKKKKTKEESKKKDENPQTKTNVCCNGKSQSYFAEKAEVLKENLMKRTGLDLSEMRVKNMTVVGDHPKSLADELVEKMTKSFEGSGLEFNIKGCYQIEDNTMPASLKEAFSMMKEGGSSVMHVVQNDDNTKELEKHVLESGENLEGNNKVDGEPSAVFGNTESGELKMISVSDLLKLKSVMKELAAKQEEEKEDKETDKIKEMMNYLPHEAKMKLYNMRVMHGETDYTRKEYEELMRIVTPHLPKGYLNPLICPEELDKEKIIKEVNELEPKKSTTRSKKMSPEPKKKSQEPKKNLPEPIKKSSQNKKNISDLQKEEQVPLKSPCAGPEQLARAVEMKGTIDVAKAGGCETAELIVFFRNEILGKHFEIRHIKSNKWMNSRICKIEDVSIKKSIYDPRVVCSIKGDEEAGKQYSLRLTNMVDICAHVDDLPGQLCGDGTPFKETNINLCRSYITNGLTEAMQWFADEGDRREHHVHRLKNLRKWLAGESQDVKCMDYPEEHEMTGGLCQVSATLASVRPGCIGNTRVDFSLFGKLMCGCPETVQLVNRFREYLISGMCYACQIYYVERQISDQEPPSNGLSRSEGEYFLGKFFRLLSRPSPSQYFGPTAKKLEDLGVDCERYEQFCRRVTACFVNKKTKRQTIKSVRNYVRKGRDIDVNKAQFDACLEMMKEAGIVKQVSNNLLLIKRSHAIEP